ncbi:MAG: PqiC family protein [Halothiobacillaceae bacterium]|nr:PqiC family protein [Halothiobacillaceae bacterium]
MRQLICHALIPATLLLLAGCAAAPSSQFYTLSASTQAAAPASKISVAVGPVSIPASVDRPQMVINTSANQVQLDEFNRWAAPLQSDINRVVAENLVKMLGTPNVTLFPQTASANADYRVSIEVQSFVSNLGEASSLDAVWTVRRMKDNAREVGRSTLSEPAKAVTADKSHDALAAAHSRAIARMSQDIADALHALERTPQAKQDAIDPAR